MTIDQRFWSRPLLRTILVAVVSSFLTLLVTKAGSCKRAGKLEIISVHFADSRLLDFKVKNTGERTVFVVLARAAVTNVAALLPDYTLSAATPVSASYGLILPVDKPPYVSEIALSQTIPAGDTDRFTVRIDYDAQTLRRIHRQMWRAIVDRGPDEITSELRRQASREVMASLHGRDRELLGHLGIQGLEDVDKLDYLIDFSLSLIYDTARSVEVGTFQCAMGFSDFEGPHYHSPDRSGVATLSHNVEVLKAAASRKAIRNPLASQLLLLIQPSSK